MVTLKKAHHVPYSRNTERVKKDRKEFALWYLKLGTGQKKVVYIDEHGVNMWCKRSRARAPREQTAHVSTPSQRNINVTNVATVSPERGSFFGQALPGGINTEISKRS